ncbi:MAG: Protein TolB [Anaerolineae bacterium]|nr:Protein TolB [Anaerolineae bacterium]
MRPLDRYLAHESGNQFVRITGDGTRLPLSFGYIHDTSLEARVRIQSGTLRMGIHSSAAGSYVVELDETGHLSVTRGLKPISEPLLVSTPIGSWSHVEMSVTGHEVRVKLDGSTVVQVTDTDPLFYGTVWFAAAGPSVEVDIDNVVLSGRIDAEPDVLIDTNVTRSVSPDVSRQSAENDRIVFYSNAGHLFTLKPDGSGLLWLTEGFIDVDHVHPSWSPNKERIAFVTQQSGGNRIHTMNSDGTDRQLAPVPLSSPYRSVQSVAWSPVDDRLLYTATNIYSVKSVYIFDMVTDTDILVGDGSAVSWSPDGTKVHIFRSEPWPSNQHNLWQVDLTTTPFTFTQLTQGGIATSGGDWSPDSGKVIYSVYGGQAHTFPAGGGPSTAISGVLAQSLSWSPDGLAVVGIRETTNRLAVYALNSDATMGTLTMEFVPPPMIELAYDPDWGWPLPDCGSGIRAASVACQPQCTGITNANDVINVREAPWGAILNTVASDIEVELLGGWFFEPVDGTPPQWWWTIRTGTIQGYVFSGLIEDINDCPRPLLQPPSPPLPELDSQCWIRLRPSVASAQVYDGAGVPLSGVTISGSDPIRAYGNSRDASELSIQHLINVPGQFPQQWVNTSLFEPAGQEFSRACASHVLGRFRRTTDPEYWSIVGSYALAFEAPVSFQTYEYDDFRNSQPFGVHSGVDLVYGPPDGVGTAFDFEVRSQHAGVVVDAGPSGIVGRYIMRNLDSVSNPFPNRNGTFYDPETRTLYFAVVWNARPNSTHERPNSGFDFGDPPFGLRDEEARFLYSIGWGFVACADLNDFQSHVEGIADAENCNAGPDRQIIIQYDSDLTDNLPDIQTTYFHITVDTHPQYEDWKGQCSARDRTATFQSHNTVCDIGVQTSLGMAKWIGWSSAPHLHYEIAVDMNGDGNFTKTEREDPLMAYRTFR